jgi:hypothetical protein
MIALLVALALTLAPAPAEPPADVAPPDYADVWSWCGARFPTDPNLAEACRWGAFEMTPTTTTEWRA